MSWQPGTSGTREVLTSVANVARTDERGFRSASGKEPILRAENLTKHFPLTQGIVFRRQVGAVKAVDGVDFNLYPGETLGLVGESGCGKSTVSKLLLRLEEATDGAAYYKGQNIFELSKRELR